MFLIIGGTELILSIYLYFGYTHTPPKTFNPATKSFVINDIVYLFGLFLEIGFWIGSRIHLSKIYKNTYGKNRSCLFTVIVLFF
jgi:hypothetical protein